MLTQCLLKILLLFYSTSSFSASFSSKAVYTLEKLPVHHRVPALKMHHIWHCTDADCLVDWLKMFLTLILFRRYTDRQ